MEEVKSFKAANYELGPDSISALASTPATASGAGDCGPEQQPLRPVAPGRHQAQGQAELGRMCPMIDSTTIDPVGQNQILMNQGNTCAAHQHSSVGMNVL